MVLQLNQAIWGSRYTCFSIFGNWRKSKKKKVKYMDTQKFIYSVKLHILHQMKPYSRVKTSWDRTYACISIFMELRQVKEIGPKCPKSWASIHRKSSKVSNSTFHIKLSLKSNKSNIWELILRHTRPYSRVKAIWGSS